MPSRLAFALLVACASLAAASVRAADPAPDAETASPPASPAPAGAPEGDKQVAGMSILGNDEAPKSLVLVPWKSSDLGSALAVAKGLDAGREPVDRKVFERAVDYYEIRAGASR